MHKIHTKRFEIDDFSHDQLDDMCKDILLNLIGGLEKIREKYIESNEKTEWYKIIQLLPSSYNQLRTCTMSYENLVNMYSTRKVHKLQEWREYCDWVETLPYANELICSCSK